MEWKNTVNLFQSVINAIQNTAKFFVVELRRLSKQTFSVKVTNLQEKVEVSGAVKVSNQPDLEKQIRNIALAVRELQKPLKALKKIDINNFPKQQPFPKFPDFPKEFSVKNMDEFVSSAEKILHAISKLNLKPVVNVPKADAPVVNVPAPVVNVPAPVVKVEAPIVNVEKPDLSDIKKIITFLEELSAKKPLPVRLTDGKVFYKALERMGDIYAGGGGSFGFQTSDGDDGRAMLNKNNELMVSTNSMWTINNIDNVDVNTIYVGEQADDKEWRIRREVKTGTVTSYLYATNKNNTTIFLYEEAWNNRTSLQYDYIY